MFDWLKKKRKYFVSYAWETKDGGGYGHCTVIAIQKIAEEDIKQMRCVIEKDNVLPDKSVVILNFIEL